MKSKEEKRIEKGKTERATGDLLSYFILHNLVSMLMFFMLTIGLGTYVYKEFTLSLMFTEEFWNIVFQVFWISVCGIIFGRATVFYAIRWYHSYKDRTTKRWSELNRGINKIGFRLAISVFLSSIAYTMGLVIMLSDAIFDETKILPLMVVYLGLKIGMYFIVRWFVGKFF